MSKLRLKLTGRTHHPDCTLGRLAYGDFQCFTLELPWKDNKPFISCIPPGVYKATKIMSPTLGLCINIQGIFGRTYIRIHTGNYTRDIKGCILVGKSIQFIDGDSIPDVGSSVAALDALMDALPNEFLIEVGLAH